MKINYSKPFQLFFTWLKDAQSNQKIVEPTAMCLATVNSENKPSSRIVLLKKFDENGFYFFTNSTSKKEEELKNNQDVALCFYWDALGRQVRIEGMVEKVTTKEDDFKDQGVPHPPFWSGFRCQPHIIEFWEEGNFRLHKRTIYKKIDGSWEMVRLYP